MKTPILVINTKSYKQAILPDSLLLARTAQDISEELGVNIALAVQPTDIYLLSSRTTIPILAQHFDPVEERATGAVSGLAIRSAGAVGSLINHSEKKLSLRSIKERIDYARMIGLSTITCSSSIDEAVSIARLNPSMLAYEPPELIGGNVSVTTKPDVLRELVSRIKSINHDLPLLCGAGIKHGKDIAKALDLGMDGVLVASGVILARDWKEKIYELASNL